MSYSSEVLTDSPLAWWRLDEASGTTLADSSGSSRSLTLNAALSAYGQTAAGVGIGGTSTTWSGTQCGQHAGSFLDGLTEFTVEAWVKFTANGYVLNRDNLAGGSARSFQFYVSSGKASFVVFGTGGGIATATSSNTLNDNAWHHIVGKFKPAASGSDTFIYVDGVLRGTSTLGGAWRSTVTFNLSLGAGLVNTTRDTPYNGGLDEVAVYGTALSDARITAHYNAGITAPPAGATGSVAATGPAATASVTGTFASNDRTGTVAATGPAATASVSATVADPSFTGSIAATGPAATAAVAGTVTSNDVAGTVSATGPAPSAAVAVSVAVPVDGTVAATGPAPTAAVGVSVVSSTLEPWTEDRSRRTNLVFVASGTIEAVPPLTELPPHIQAERMLTRHSVTVPELTSIAGAIVDGAGKVRIPDPAFAALSAIPEDVGTLHVLVGGKDVTYFRDALTLPANDRAEEPFGDSTARIDFPQVTAFDVPGEGDVSWMVPGARVELVLKRPGGTVTRLWAGHLVSDDNDVDGTSAKKSWEAQGTLWQAATYVHQVPNLLDPTDIGTLISKALNSVTSRRYPKVPAVKTGIMSRQRGSWSDSEMAYAQGLLATAWTPGGNQWTVAKKSGSVNSYVIRQKKTGSQWTTTYGAPGVDVALSRDLTQSRNVIWGRGIGPDGYAWMNTHYPNLRKDNAPAYPYASAGTVMSVGATDSGTLTGDGVSAWQRRARDLGYSIVIDGVFNATDAGTARAIQRRYGILVDGIVGPQTWAATFDIGANGGDLSGAIRLPLAADPRTQPYLFRADGSKVGRNPDYDPSVIIVSDDIDFGSGVTRAQGMEAAQQIIDREANPGLTGSITLHADPREGSRMLIPAGDRIKLVGYEGADHVLHISGRERDWTSLTVTLDVDERARDAMTLDQIRGRNKEARRDPARRPGNVNRRSRLDADQVTPYDGESGAGWIPRHALYGGLWTVIRVPVSELGRVAKIDVKTSGPAAKFCIGLFGAPITAAHLIRYVGANPLATSSPFETHREILEDRFGWIEAWGSQGQAAGYFPGSEGSSPLSGRLVDTGGFEYVSAKAPWIWVAEWSASSTFIEGRILPAPVV